MKRQNKVLNSGSDWAEPDFSSQTIFTRSWSPLRRLFRIWAEIKSLWYKFEVSSFLLASDWRRRLLHPQPYLQSHVCGPLTTWCCTSSNPKQGPLCSFTLPPEAPVIRTQSSGQHVFRLTWCKPTKGPFCMRKTQPSLIYMFTAVVIHYISVPYSHQGNQEVVLIQNK